MAKKNFQSMDSLKSVELVINEANNALENKKRTILESPLSEVVAGALGVGIGGAGSFAALFFGGKVVGLSAAGITSALAVAGKLVGGGMAAGVGVLAAPIVILGGGGIFLASHLKKKKLAEAKDRLLKLAVEKQHSITVALKHEVDASKERADYLNGLNILLQGAIRDLKADIA
jgi:hypothetical protein